MSTNRSETAQSPEQQGETTVPAVKKTRKWLTAAFNMASGMAVALAVKTVVITCAATIASPAATIFIAAAASGVATSYLRHALGNYRLVKAGEKPLKFTFKQAAFGAGFGMLGAGVVAGLDHFAPNLVTNAVSSIKDFFGFAPAACVEKPDLAPLADLQPAATPDLPVEAPVVAPDANIVAAPEPTPEPVPETQIAETPVTEDVAEEVQTPETPAPESVPDTGHYVVTLPEITVEGTAPDCLPCVETPKAIDCVQDLAKAEGVSDRVQDAVKRAASANARVSAQGVKDLGYFLMNGFDGMPKDPCLAVQLLKEAAENGNIQAKVDLAYLEYHGNSAAGVTANPDAALEKMKELNTTKARWFVAQWTGVGSDVPASAPTPQASVPQVNVPATPSAAPLSPTPTVNLPVSEPVVTVDVTGDRVVETTTSPIPATPPIGETIQSGPGMDCTALIGGGSGNIDFVCSLPENDNNFVVGDKVIIQRPALLQFVR